VVVGLTKFEGLHHHLLLVMKTSRHANCSCQGDGASYEDAHV
jgi:hypothetical protein